MQEIELTLTMVENQLYDHDHFLDFSKEEFINRIMAFEKVPEKSRLLVTSINFNNNKLKQIDQINLFSRLTRLEVSHNQLSSVRLKIENLQHLDLSYNKLTLIPDLGSLKKLRVVNLSNNLIVKMDVVEIQQLSRDLIELYIQSNLIKYKQGYDVKGVIEELNNRSIQILDISKNPFILSKPQIEEDFAEIPSLLILNGKSVDILQRDPDASHDDLANVSFAQSEYAESDDTQIAQEFNYRIQNCVNDPTKSVEQLKKINDLVTRLVSQPNVIDHYFQNKNPEIQQSIEQSLELFLQNCFLFAQNQHNYVEQILKALAQLAIVQHLGFGRRCFEVVVEIVRSGIGQQTIARNIIKTYSIPLIQQQSDLNLIPTFVLEGILRTIQERNDHEMIPKDLIDNFISWLNQIISNYRGSTENFRDEQIHRDVLCLNFIAEMGNYRKFALEFKARNILTKCIILFKILIPTDLGQQYIAVLTILYNCSIVSSHCAIEILESRKSANNFVKDLEDELRGYLFMFKKFRNSLVNPETKENRDKVIERYEKVEMLISVYGAITKYRNFNKTTLKDDFLVGELLIFATIPAIHPYLVNSICIFIRKLLKNRVMHSLTQSLDAGEMVKYINNKVQNCVQLLQYLGGDFYQPMMIQLDPSAQKLTKNLANCVNVKVHKTFKNIVQLLKFYSKNAIDERSPIADICLEVAANLNNNGRDEALFLALATPNDDVRLAVVRCLLTIKVSELDSREVGKLATLLGTYKNLGAGKTESVISNIMMILSKIVLGDSTDAKEDFVTIFSENCTLDSLDILLRNQERDLRLQPEENAEKVELSFGVVNFLKTLHGNTILKRNLKGIYQAQALKKSLLDEEAYITSEYLDIEIERTYIGKQCSYLIATLFNKDSLFPYGRESDRVLLRLAENLENREEDKSEDLEQFGGLYKFKEIEKYWLEQSRKRKLKQLELWDFMKEYKEIDVEQRDKDIMNEKEGQDTFTYLDSQHSLFYTQEGAINLLGFLVGRNHSTRTMQLKEQFQEMFSNKLNFDRTIQSILLYIQDTVDDYKDLLEEGFQKKMLSVSRRDEYLDFLLRGIAMPTDPLRGFAKQNQFFNPNKVILFPIPRIKQNQKQEEEETNALNVDNVLNRDEQLYGKLKQMIPPENRVVTIATYLRIVYALLGYGPDLNGRRVAQQLALKTEFLRELTSICEWADWRLGNIAVKYLKIINYILLNAKACSEQSFMTGFFIIAKALRDILDDISLKIQNEDKKPLKYDDIYLIKEVCECMYRIANNINDITYFDKIQSIIQQNMIDPKITDSEKQQALITIDQKVDEHIISSVMPLYAFTVFIEIMVWDMQQEKRLSSSSINNERVFRLKSAMRKYLIKLIGLYIIKCRGQKLEILQAFNKLEVFDKKFIRQSFIQEILDEQYFFDYKYVIEKCLIEKKTLNNYLAENEILSVTFFIRCFYQYKNDSITCLAVIVNSLFLIIEIEEDIIRKRPTEHKIWQDEFQKIKFKKFNILKRLEFDSIEGFFIMECAQRICMVFSQVAQKPFAIDEKSLESAILLFPKLSSLHKFQKNIKELPFENDIISQGALLKISELHEPKFLIWVCVNPDKPIINRFEEFNRNTYLLLNNGKFLKLYQCNYENWFFLQKNLVVQSTIQSKYKKMHETIRRQKCEESYFKEKGSYDLGNLSLIIIDQTLNTQLTLSFGIGKANQLRLLFGCDNGREQFKYSLMRYVSIDKFKQQNLRQ